MPEEIPWWNVTLGEQALAWTAVLVVVTVIIALVKLITTYVHPVVKKFTTLYDRLIGRAPNPRIGDKGDLGIFMQMAQDQEKIAAQLSEVRAYVERRLGEQDETVLEIKSQVTPNHNSTDRLADQIHDLRELVKTFGSQLHAHVAEAPATMAAMIASHAATCPVKQEDTQ